MEIYIRNLNTDNGAWIKLDAMSDFDDLDEAIAGIAKGDDWDMADTDNETNVPSSLIRGPKDALTIVLAKDEGIEDTAIQLVAEHNGGIDCTDMGDVQKFIEKCQDVQVYDSKDHFIEEMAAELMNEETLKSYFDEDSYIHDAEINGEFDSDTDDKDEYIEMILADMPKDDLVRYFDGERWFRDYDIDLNGSWEEQSGGGADRKFYLYQA